jgi:hypothetical protein
MKTNERNGYVGYEVLTHLRRLRRTGAAIESAEKESLAGFCRSEVPFPFGRVVR